VTIHVAIHHKSALFPVADLRSYLIGTWELHRTIDDRLSGEDGTFNGQAIFDALPTGLRYAEQGVLSLPSYKGDAVRGYFYAFSNPAIAEVRFENGGFFHDLDLRAGRWTATHPCGEDLYEGSFSCQGPDQWQAVWHVTGPRKDLRLESVYGRRGD